MMMVSRWYLWAASLVLVLVAAPTSAMVIPDAVDSAEIAATDGDSDAAADDAAYADIDTTNTDTWPTTSSEPPGPSGIELLQNIGWGCGLVKPVSYVPLEKIMGRWYVLEIYSPGAVKQQQESCAGVDFWRWDDEENNLMPDVAPPPIVGPEHLVLRGFNKHVNDHHTSSYRVDTATVVHGSGGAIWDQAGERLDGPCPSTLPAVRKAWGTTASAARGGNTASEQVRSVSTCTVAMGATVAVIDFTPDARFMTVTTCVRGIGFEWTSVLGRDPNSTALAREELHHRLRETGLRYVHTARLQNNSECVYPPR